MAPDPVKEEIMGLRIKNDIAAMNAYRSLSVTDGQLAKSLGMSSGFRINRVGAAGPSISEGLRAQVGDLEIAVRNARDGISVVQTAEDAMNEVAAENLSASESRIRDTDIASRIHTRAGTAMLARITWAGSGSGAQKPGAAHQVMAAKAASSF
jgi:flagellin-like hook-associated protein FlgL